MVTVNYKCGTCQSKTGCAGNICLIITGDIQSEYCYGSSTCGNFSSQTSVTVGSCTVDQSGSNCQSGLCVSSGSALMCYGSSAFSLLCANTTTLSMQCSNGVVTMTFRGGYYTQLYGSAGFTVNTTFGTDCPFTSGYQTISSCSGDGLGNACTCCATASFQGMVSAYGNCVPQDSPLVQVKSDIKNKNNGFQTIFSLILVLFQIMFILI